MTKYCTWAHEDDIMEGVSWHTGCENRFMFMDDGSPKEHGFKYCCYCGGSLRQKGGAG